MRPRTRPDVPIDRCVHVIRWMCSRSDVATDRCVHGPMSPRTDVTTHRCVHVIKSMCSRSGLTTDRCVHVIRSMCSRSGVTTDRCVHRPMCPRTDVSTVRCIKKISVHVRMFLSTDYYRVMLRLGPVRVRSGLLGLGLVSVRLRLDYRSLGRPARFQCWTLAMCGHSDTWARWHVFTSDFHRSVHLYVTTRTHGHNETLAQW